MKRKSLNAQKINHNFISNLLNKDFIKPIFSKFEKKLNSRESFLVAVSGGPDSLALAFLSKCYEEKYGAKFNYCIIDHKLRKDSSKEAQDVCKILKKINIKCKIIKWIGSKPSSNIQAIARVKRYSLLSGECSRLKLNNILLGHHKNDLNENFFIRMTRGSGLKGLVSLDEKTKINKINYIRPLLEFDKKQLEKITLKVFKIFVKDPSNFNKDFKRVRIRKLIENLKNEGLDENKLILTIKNLKTANNALDFYANQNIKNNLSFVLNKKKATLNLNFFLQPDEVIMRSLNIVMRKISKKYYPPRGKSTNLLIKEIKSHPKFKKMTLGGCLFQKINQTVIISSESG